MGVDYNKLKEILERKANKAINHLDELKCFVPEFREVLDSVLYISETLKDLMFLDTECPDCKKEKPRQEPPRQEPPARPEYIGKPYKLFGKGKRANNRLVMFYSNHCQPCQYLKPILETYVVEHKFDLELVLVDEEAGRNHAQEHEVHGWPTVFVVKNNVIEHVMIGADVSSSIEVTKNRLEEELTPFFI